jgi:hypothetical protein
VQYYIDNSCHASSVLIITIMQAAQEAAIEEQICRLEDAIASLTGVDNFVLAQGNLWTALNTRLSERGQVRLHPPPSPHTLQQEESTCWPVTIYLLDL